MTPADVQHIIWRLDRQDEQLAQIKRHVEATNGRVKALELWKARIEGVKAGVSWLPVMVGSIATSTVTGVLVWAITH